MNHTLLVTILLLATSSCYIFGDHYIMEPPAICEFQQNEDTFIITRGSSTIQAKPDHATLNAQGSSSGKTASQAINNLAILTSQIINILKANSISKGNYKTTSFRTYPNTTYSNGVATVWNHIASQSFSIMITGIDSTGKKIGKLIDDLAKINGIVINGLSFGLLDKIRIFQLARTKAFENAKLKAEDYTRALSLRLGKVLNIKDNISSAPITTQSIQKDQALVGQGSSVPTQINVGTIPISYQVEVRHTFSQI